MSDGLSQLDGRGAADFDALLARYAPANETYDVTLPHGERLTFRALRSYSELKQQEAAAIRWFKSLPSKGSPSFEMHPFKEFLPLDAASAIAAYNISDLSVEPKIEQRDALKMLAAPFLVNFILRSMDHANRSIASIIETQLLEEAKNESGATDGGGSSSPSPETPSANTPTS
jgi:hypothetical protein